jgi:hypothetical protein
MVKRAVIILLMLPLFAAHGDAFEVADTAGFAAAAPKPGILVELFTSEGCSSCPPADMLLRQLDFQRVTPEAEIVVLGEHVDYWDHNGWRDRFSSRDYTDRQAEYAQRFHIPGPYTPQMVVDGSREFVGNDAPSLKSALAKAAAEPKVLIFLTAVATGSELRVSIKTGALPEQVRQGDLYVALADNSDETQVKGGENTGRRLQHVAVARILQRVGKVARDGTEKELKLKEPKDSSQENLRVVAFIQESGYGRVIGAAGRTLKDSGSTP